MKIGAKQIWPRGNIQLTGRHSISDAIPLNPTISGLKKSKKNFGRRAQLLSRHVVALRLAVVLSGDRLPRLRGRKCREINLSRARSCQIVPNHGRGQGSLIARIRDIKIYQTNPNYFRFESFQSTACVKTVSNRPQKRTHFATPSSLHPALRNGKIINLMLTLSGISKAYGGRVLFDDTTLQLNREDRIGLVGPNGAGKSTLFSLILGGMLPSVISRKKALPRERKPSSNWPLPLRRIS